LPDLKKGQILVKMKFSSICHTQIQEIDGSRGKDKFLPHCLGHEATGLVIKVGKEVKKVKPRDKVCLSWVPSSGINAGGTTYYYNKKKINAGPINTFSEYSIISENKVHKLSSNANLKKSVLLGCAIPTAFNCIFSNTINTKKKKILIIGCGGVGLATVYAAKIVKFKEIYVYEKNKSKVKIAKKLGAKYFIETNKLSDFKDYFDYVIECSGNSDLLNQTLNLSKRFGGKVLIIGNYKNNKYLVTNPWQLLYGKQISGSWIASFNYDLHFKKFEKAIGKLNFKLLFGNRTYSLNKINSAINDLKKGRVIRPLLKL
jgi:Zn-dependent alcohol dehydrogenase